MMLSLVRPLAVIALFVVPSPAAPRPAQSQDATPLVGIPRGPLDPASIVVKYFNPAAFEAGELQGSASELFGGEILLRGVANADGSVENISLPHFVVLRNTLVIRDTAPAAAAIAKLLGELDQTEQARQQQQARQEQISQERAAEVERDNQLHEAAARGEIADTMVQIRPRYVNLATLGSALETFQRQVTYSSANGKPGWVTNSITVVQDAGMVVVCETRDRVDRLVTFAEQVDRPQPQALVSVTLIRAGDGDGASAGGGNRNGGATLPKELTENLRALVPYGSFEPMAVGVLRCSLATERESSMQMDLGGKGDGAFSFIPSAFNPDTGEITLSQCQFTLQLQPEKEGEQGSNHSFTTNLTFKSGEYVVLGAVGARPIFVVLRAELVKKTN
jgi:hypothetical protein